MTTTTKNAHGCHEAEPGDDCQRSADCVLDPGHAGSCEAWEIKLQQPTDARCLTTHGEDVTQRSAGSWRRDGDRHAIVRVDCCRCGGTGIYSRYHGTCFRCGGRGSTGTKRIRLYSQDEFAKLEAQRARKAQQAQAKAQAEAQAKRDAMQATLNADQELADAFAVADAHSRARSASIVTDIRAKLLHYGSISDAQRALVLKIAAQLTANAQREADAPAVQAGAQTIVGIVISVKEHENSFGTRLVMTVQDDAGRRFWGTVPRALVQDVKPETRVSFAANVKPSDDSPAFGFFQRPTKAQIVA